MGDPASQKRGAVGTRNERTRSKLGSTPPTNNHLELEFPVLRTQVETSWGTYEAVTARRIMIITFIGYRGTGKSRIAPLLAERLQWPWADADVELERNTGRSIRDIFAKDGEPTFRQYERQQLVELLKSPKLVLAAGGGAILNADTRADFRAAGPVVWLQADEATIADRILGDRPGSAHRPNLTAQGGREEIHAMLTLRTPLYAETATITVRTDGRHPQSVASEIFAALPTAIRSTSGGRP